MTVTRAGILATVVMGLGVLGLTAGVRVSAAPDDAASLPALKVRYHRPLTIPFPAENVFTRDREYLGRLLFFDPRLSGSNFISCATCHNPALSWSDGLPRALGQGMKELRRRTPTILNVAWAEALFWDGRAETLEAQALGPIQSPDEMNQDPEELVAELRRIRSYVTLFQVAYPGEGITPASIANALATFQRTVVSGIAPFDAWIAGDEGAISEPAKRGFLLFNTKARCAICHRGWTFSDSGFHDIGVKTTDVGRGKQFPRLVTMQYAFKTPTLRNIDRRAPYMHNGSLATLAEVLELYDRGGVARPSRSPDIRPLGLSAEEKQALLAFLGTLTSVDPPISIPELPR